MVKITLIEHDGTEHVGDARPGISLMEYARSIDYPGIVGECGGVQACATCQVYVDDDWIARTGAPSAEETEMLEVANDVRPSSRLSCQIHLTPELDGLIVRTPKDQL